MGMDCREYLEAHVSPILEALTSEIMIYKPQDPMGFMIGWMASRVSSSSDRDRDIISTFLSTDSELAEKDVLRLRICALKTAIAELERGNEESNQFADGEEVDEFLLEVRAKFEDSDVWKHYTRGDLLGKGNYAEVYKATPTKNRQSTHGVPKEVAVEIIDKSKVEDMKNITRETDIMKLVDHPNIIKLFETDDDPKGRISLVMELVTGGELFDSILDGNYSETDGANCFGQIADALKYLHGNKIVHRDLNWANILYASDNPNEENYSCIKLTNFGSARKFTDNEVMKAKKGTDPHCVAPEVFKQSYTGGTVDMWSAGVVLYSLLCGFPPFDGVNGELVGDKIKKGHYSFPSPRWDHVSKEAKDLVSKLLQLDPQKRLTAEQVLLHPWVTLNYSSGTKEVEGVADSDSLHRYIF